MALPQTASSEATAIAMSDFGEKRKEMDVTVTSIDGTSSRPVLGRRRTSDKNHSGVNASNLDDHDEDKLTKFGNILWYVESST